jgi:mRNA-degrading endonuclease toxin of MazEF toxin-antitoxin module
MRRGEVRLVDLAPVRGAEANKRVRELDGALRLHLAL